MKSGETVIGLNFADYVHAQSKALQAKKDALMSGKVVQISIGNRSGELMYARWLSAPEISYNR